jgi:hypothetical protein
MYSIWWLIGVSLASVLVTAFLMNELYVKPYFRNMEKRLFDEEIRKIAEDAESRILSKNDLIFNVIGMRVSDSLASVVKVEYVSRGSLEGGKAIVLYFRAVGNGNAHQVAIAHLGMINDLLQEIRQRFTLKRKMVGRILDIEAE